MGLFFPLSNAMSVRGVNVNRKNIVWKFIKKILKILTFSRNTFLSRFAKGKWLFITSGFFLKQMSGFETFAGDKEHNHFSPENIEKLNSL